MKAEGNGKVLPQRTHERHQGLTLAHKQMAAFSSCLAFWPQPSAQATGPTPYLCAKCSSEQISQLPGEQEKGNNNNVAQGHHSTIIYLALNKQLPSTSQHARVIKAHLQREFKQEREILPESLRPTWAEAGCAPPGHRITAVHPPLSLAHRHCQDCSKHSTEMLHRSLDRHEL